VLLVASFKALVLVSFSIIEKDYFWEILRTGLVSCLILGSSLTLTFASYLILGAWIVGAWVEVVWIVRAHIGGAFYFLTIVSSSGKIRGRV
jgi:hypothetical protein